MNKKTFHKKWYYRLLQLIFFGSLIIFSLFLIIAGIFDSDVEIAGFFWAGVLCLVYWLIKRVFYYLMFREKIFGKNQKGVSIGFVFGMIVAFVWLMIVSILYPAEEIANIVIVSLLISGLIFGFIGYCIQKYFKKIQKYFKKRAINKRRRILGKNISYRKSLNTDKSITLLKNQ